MRVGTGAEGSSDTGGDQPTAIAKIQLGNQFVRSEQGRHALDKQAG